MTQEEVVRAAEQEGLTKHGWYIHYHQEKDEWGQINCHTHGIAEKYGTLDLQVVMNLHPTFLKLVVWAVVDLLDAGLKPALGQRYYLGEQLDRNVTLVPAMEDGREVWRIILPDNDGKLSYEEQEYPWCNQWEGAGL